MTWHTLLVHPGSERRVAGLLKDRERLLAAQFGPNAPPLLATAMDREERPYTLAAGGIAVIPIKGFLAHDWPYLSPYGGVTGYEAVAFQVDRAARDPDVKGILAVVNSLGGEVSSCFDVADRLRAARVHKPVWAVANEHAYSAAYALASQADRLVVPRTGGLGSVGVVRMHMDLSAALDQGGIKVTLLHAGKHKVDGNAFAPLPEAVADQMRAELEATRQLFAETVAEGRGLTIAEVLKTEAQTFTAGDAVAAGLADAVMPAADVLPAFLADLGLTGDPSEPETAPDHEPEDPAMSENASSPTAAEIQQAVATANARASAILSAPEAEGRQDLAKHFTFNTDLSAEAAIAALAASPRASGGLGQLMPENPDVGAGTPEAPTADQAITAAWDASVSRVCTS